MNKNIKEWACSFSGCDGGNVKASVWLCGIEWGGGSKNNYYETELPREIENGAVVLKEESYNWKNSLTYKYGRDFAKLYTAIKGGNVADYRNTENLKGNEIFKTNLYPIAFDSTDHNLWHKYRLDNITGFENKYLFNTWCFFNRFPVFSELREKCKPKLIVCTGVNYLRDFIMFFSGKKNIGKINTDVLIPKSESDKYDRAFYWVLLDNNCLLVVIPFFGGRYGLNSDHLIKELGDKIITLLNEYNLDIFKECA